MHAEKLIELVREFSFIYDTDDKRYSDFDKKEAAWREIGRLLNEPAKRCKTQWNYLRDNYRRALKKRRDPETGKVGNKTRKWKFEDEMSFLSPFIKEREARPLVLHASDESNDEVDCENTNLIHEIKKERTITPTIYDVSTSLVEQQNTDDIDLFFRSMAATVKKFPPYTQAIAKAQVFNIISEIELQRLSNKDHDNPPSYSSFSPKPNLITGT